MKTNRHSHSSNKGRSGLCGKVELVGPNHNFELLLTQIFCRRLNLAQGIVSLGVGLPYDLLRFILCATICPSFIKTTNNNHFFHPSAGVFLTLFLFLAFGLLSYRFVCE